MLGLRKNKEKTSPAASSAPSEYPKPPKTNYDYEASDLLRVEAVKPSADKTDRVCFHPCQPWLAIVQRGNRAVVWNYESGEVRGRHGATAPANRPCDCQLTPPPPRTMAGQVVYETQLGGADDGALQEAALHARAAHDAMAAGAPAPPPLSPGREASLASKSTASGAVRDVRFLDLDVVFWQLAGSHLLRHNAYDASGVPAMPRGVGLAGRRWLVLACENKVVLHDLASADTRDIPRTAFDSKAPTCLGFLLLNAPALLGYGGGGAGGASAAAAVAAAAGDNDGEPPPPLPGRRRGAGGAAAPRGPRGELLPLLAVGTSGGSIYLLDAQRFTVYAKLVSPPTRRSGLRRLLYLRRDGGFSGLAGGCASRRRSRLGRSPAQRECWRPGRRWATSRR